MNCPDVPRQPRFTAVSLRFHDTMRLLLFLYFLCAFGMSRAQSRFENDFRDSTLRVDYIFSGNAHSQSIALGDLHKGRGWAGRRVNLDKLPLEGNGQITMRSAEDGRIIYRTSFSSLFQEWQTTEEASMLHKAFENVFQLPMPRKDANLTITLFDTRRRVCATLTHRVRVDDILIRPVSSSPTPLHRYLHRGGSRNECIDIAIVAEGYTTEEQETFFRHAQTAADELLKYAPFSEHRKRINIIGVALDSKESGVSIPHQGIWKETALLSHFDTFYSNRYLTTLHIKRLHDFLSGIPYEHIIILANTDNYGGGGIYNSYTLASARHPAFQPVVVHEFGHSFGGLADEYFYDDQHEEFYFPEIEPWEPNITTLADFSKKWKDLLPLSTPIPTPSVGLDNNDTRHIGVYEGGGYRSKGVFRAFQNCRMRTNDVPDFCLVCRRSLDKLIRFHTEESSH